MGLVEAFLESLARPPATGETVVEMVTLMGPVWFAFLFGVFVGWVWKSRWVNSRDGEFVGAAPSASPSASVFSIVPKTVSKLRPGASSSDVDNGENMENSAPTLIGKPSCSSSHPKQEGSLIVTDEDFKHLYRLVERKDGGPAWKHMMKRSTPGMTYEAWQRDLENGPPQYCTRTAYEDATPELLRDFYWDDEFRSKWDDMHLHAVSLEECLTTGTMVVHWIRKFPFFCSDREYTIGRRIWESGRTFYCVTKGVPCPLVPRRQKPRRVDLYYSSWCIQPAESKKGNDQSPACEVVFFHHEDMGIPWEIAKLGVRHGMWGTARNVERGFRAYQKERALGKPITRTTFMAQITTKVVPNKLDSIQSELEEEDAMESRVESAEEKPKGPNVPKLVLIGGVVLLACTVDHGLLTRTIIFGMARRFANIGRRPSCPSI